MGLPSSPYSHLDGGGQGAQSACPPHTVDSFLPSSFLPHGLCSSLPPTPALPLGSSLHVASSENLVTTLDLLSAPHFQSL